MIPRYSKKEISRIWSDGHKFETFLKVELALLRALETSSRIPKGTAKTIEKNVEVHVEKIERLEEKVKHDVIAFCTSITDQLPPEISKFFHFGVTSSDIIDTTLSLQIKESLEEIFPVFKKLLKTLYQHAENTKDIICMGRSHGMFAEPMSFGQKWLSFYAEFSRRFSDLKNFYHQELTAQFSGSVGNYTILTPDIEQKAAQMLNLKVESVSTQILPRDRVAKLINTNALIASAIERLALEIRHLHRSDVHELQENFSKGQKGSSAMPHKKNPIASENLTGIARILRSHASVALENIALWHERDISHSSAERLYLPDNLGLLFYALERLNSTIKELEFFKDVIESKVKKNQFYLSSYYLHQLIERTKYPREELYEMVQEASYTENFYETLSSMLKQKRIDIVLPKPTFAETKKIYTKHIDTVFKRVQKDYPLPTAE